MVPSVSRTARIDLLVAAILLVAFGAVVPLILRRIPPPGARRGTVLVAGARFPAAMAPMAGGGLRYGERLTGRVREVDRQGRLLSRPLAQLDVSTGGQRGLLGLAIDRSGVTFAAWTRPDGRLVVGRLTPGAADLIWLGPRSARLANGGHLVIAPDGSLVIGVGDLEQPNRVPRAEFPNGKLLRLDPRGGLDQIPTIISAGWNNPFAFTFTPGGALWVADNAPGKRPERLARGDRGGAPSSVSELTGKIAPSGLAALGDGRLALCGFVSRDLRLLRIERSGIAIQDGPPLLSGCSLGVVRLADGRLAYANETSINVVRP